MEYYLIYPRIGLVNIFPLVELNVLILTSKHGRKTQAKCRITHTVLSRPGLYINGIGLYTSQLRTHQTPAVQRNRRPINKCTSPTCQKQAGPRNILWTPYPPQWNPTHNHIPKILQRRGHHFAFKRSTRQRITRNIPPPQMIRKHPTQLMQPRLTRTVRKRLQRRDLDPVYAPDIDDPRRVVRGRGGFEERGAGLGDSEDPSEVEGEDAGPRRFGEFGVGRPPGGARVVDQDVELRFALLELVHHSFTVFRFVEVGGDVVGATFTWGKGC